MGKLRAVVLSAGAWSRTSHIPTLIADPDVDLVCVSSQRQATLGAIAREFGVRNVTTDWRRALEFEPDIAVVSSPPIAHRAQVITALNRGAHVLVEKPVAMDGATAKEMLEAAEHSRRSLVAGFGWPAATAFARTRDLVADGALGRSEHVMCHLAVQIRELLQGGTDGGWGADSASETATYSNPAISGGGAAAVSMAHQLGLVSWLIGESFVDVHARMTPPDSPPELHVAASASMSGGSQAALSVGATHPFSTRPQWHLGIYGSEGQVWVDSFADLVRYVSAKGEVTEWSGADGDGSYDPGAPTRALIACGRGDAAPDGMSGRLAAHVVAVTDALYASAHTGETTHVES